MRVWGTGKASREFLYAKDLGVIIMKMLGMEHLPQRVIVSKNEQVSIKEVVEKLCKISEFGGEIIWETDKPEGQRARETDLGVLNSLLEPQYTDFDVALEESYRWFEENYPNVRM
jgi:GDP-L-fucose synthase